MIITPVGDDSSSMTLSASVGVGKERVMVWTMTTPREKVSSLSVYLGLARRASGGMKAGVPGHWVILL